jgi:replicative DNA helicase
MDVELALISRMIQTDGVAQVIAAGVEPEHFHDQELRAIYQHCVDFSALWHQTPSDDALRRRFPDFRRQVVRDELGYLIQEFVEESALRSAIVKWRDIGHMIDEIRSGQEPKRQVVEHFMEHAREMANLVPTSHASKLSDMADRVATIRRQQDLGARPGVRIGIPVLDEWIYVVRNSNFVVHAAYSHVGKSTGLVRSAIQAFEEGERPLFFSLEMEADEIWEMFDAAIVGLSRTAINRRELGKEDWERYEAKAQEMKARQNDIIVVDDTDGAPTIDKLAARVERYGSGAVFVDYLSLMSATSSKLQNWERVEQISRSLKAMARSMKIKLYAAAQNNRDAAEHGPTADNIAFSNAVFQDCDKMIGYHQDPEMGKIDKVEVRVVKNRGGALPPASTKLFERWDRDRMIFETWTNQHNWAIRREAESA